MELGELSWSIRSAVNQMRYSTIIDEKILNICLFEIAQALLKADVQEDLLELMKINIKNNIKFNDFVFAHFPVLVKGGIIQRAIFNELCHVFDTGKPSFKPKKGKTSVIMFVGLKGSGKTTTCTRYACYHQKKGWKPALVCANTFRTRAFDQLKQKATKAKIPFYGSLDPVKNAIEGVERVKKETNCDLIIVDTSGRHLQEAALFEETRQLAEAMKPDLVIFVMDGSIGQAAFSQAQAFNRSVSVGAVIVTKTEGAAKGVGALSAVAATKSPVIFLETGKRMGKFEVFDVKPFVSRLLGMQDCSGSKKKEIEVVPLVQQLKRLEKLSKGNLTLRIMYEEIQNVLNMGPRCQVLAMLIGFISSELMLKDRKQESIAKMKSYMTMMDSMTNEELDSTDPNLMEKSRIKQIAQGSGCQVRDVMEMLERYKYVAENWSKMKERLQILKKGDMSNVLPPEVLKEKGARGAHQNLMKQMVSSKEKYGLLGRRIVGMEKNRIIHDSEVRLQSII